MTNYCDFSDFWTARREHVVTQYRESPNLLAFMELYTTSLVPVGEALCDLVFDIDTSVGDALTLIGKIVGFPRTHCSGTRTKAFGFCEDSCSGRRSNVGGFCDSEWACGEGSFLTTAGEYTFVDDELYRKFLKSMVLRNDNDFTRSTLREAVKLLFGENAGILRENSGHVDIFTGGDLTDEEYDVAHLYELVLPIAPGVSVGIYENNQEPFGFGNGWGGFCNGDFPSQIYAQGI